MIQIQHSCTPAILFVSHHFDEIFSIADSVTVIRDGRVTGTRSIDELSEDQLVAMVIGKEIVTADSVSNRGADDAVVFEARSVGGATVKGIDLTIHEGEIVGGGWHQRFRSCGVTADHITVCTVSAGGRDREASPADRPAGGRAT